MKKKILSLFILAALILCSFGFSVSAVDVTSVSFDSCSVYCQGAAIDLLAYDAYPVGSITNKADDLNCILTDLGETDSVYYLAASIDSDADALNLIQDAIDENDALVWTEYEDSIPAPEADGYRMVLVKVVGEDGASYLAATGAIVTDTEGPDVKITGINKGIQTGDIPYTITINDLSSVESVKVDVLVNGKKESSVADPETNEGGYYENAFTLSSDSIRQLLGVDEEDSLSNLIDSTEVSIPCVLKDLSSNNIEIRVTATDRAGNKTEESTSAMIDNDDPQIMISYDNNDVCYGSYFNAGRNLTIVYKEANFDPDKATITVTINGKTKTYTVAALADGECPDVVLVADRVDSEADKKPSEHTKDRTNTYVFGIGIIEEDEAIDNDYTLAFKVTDSVGHTTGTVNSGTAAAPLSFTIDTIAPVIEATFYAADGTVITPGEEEPYYSNGAISVDLSILDRNFSTEDSEDQLKISLSQTDFDGNKIDAYAKENITAASTVQNWMDGTKDNQYIYSMENFVNDGNYVISATYKDLAGNEVELPEAYFTIDRTAPEGTITIKTSSETATYTGFSDTLYFAHFDKKDIEVTNNTTDATSGVATVEYAIYDPGVNARGTFKGITEDELHTLDWKEWKDFLSIKKSSQGFVYMRVTDMCGNTAYFNSKGGCIAEDTPPSPPDIAIRINDAGQGIYNKDVPFTISVTDPGLNGTYSGLRSVSWTVERDGVITQSGNYDSEFTDPTLRKQTLTRSETVKASLNDSNHVVISVKAEDYAGNTIAASKEIAIDITAPVISVIYDRNDPKNEKYYDSARRATIIVKERNFDVRQANLVIKALYGSSAKIGSWSISNKAGKSNDAENTCIVIFDQDDSYSFTCSFTDKAGNSASYGRTDSFVIDTTDPVISYSFDNNSAKNGKYFNRRRIATITVKERNFAESDFNAIITPEGVIPLGKWTHSGDTHTTHLTFDRDSTYSFKLSFTDLAGNRAKTVSADEFVIDMTPPELTVIGVSNDAAYSGTAQPVVSYTDLHLDRSACAVSLKNKYTSSEVTNRTTASIYQGVQLTYADIPHEAANDGVYVLNGYATDLAGNKSTAEVTFSVNRFGSTYTLSDPTAKFIDRYYNKDAEELVIYETNTNDLVWHSITLAGNSQTKTLVVDEDYTLVVNSTNDNWKQYEYHISKELFDTEGPYEIMLYSKDEAGNTQDNKSKDLPISFMIDRTAPSVVVTGIEKGEKYQASEVAMTVSVTDNIGVSEVVVAVGPDKTTFDSDAIRSAGGVLKVNISEKASWQEINVSASDTAGNVTNADTIKVLVTNNIFALYGAFIGLGAVLVGAAFAAFFFLKKKREKAK